LWIRDVYSGSRVKQIPGPGFGSASRNFSIFNPKNCFENISRDVHPGSRIQGSKRHRIPDPDPQHCNFFTLNTFTSPWLIMSDPITVCTNVNSVPITTSLQKFFYFSQKIKSIYFLSKKILFLYRTLYSTKRNGLVMFVNIFYIPSL
jgi:hypothetical protein